MEKFMESYFIWYLIGIIALTLLMLVRLFMNEGVYNRFIGILVMCTRCV